MPLFTPLIQTIDAVPNSHILIDSSRRIPDERLEAVLLLRATLARIGNWDQEAAVRERKDVVNFLFSVLFQPAATEAFLLPS